MSPNMFEKGMKYPKKDNVAENDMCNAYPLLPNTHIQKKIQHEEFCSFHHLHLIMFFKKTLLGIPLIKLSDNLVDFQISLRTKIFFS